MVLAAGCQSVEPAFVPPTVAERAAEEHRDEQRRLIRAGFAPLEVLAAQGLEVQRVDPMWGLLDYPSVELTRDRAGTVTVRLKYWGHERGQSVPAEVWESLAARAPAAFRPADPEALRRRDREVVRRYGHCHSWHRLEAVLAGAELRITASPCMGDLQRASLAYADALARIAIDYIELCEPARQLDEIYRALEACGRRFGPPTDEYRQQVG